MPLVLRRTSRVIDFVLLAGGLAFAIRSWIARPGQGWLTAAMRRVCPTDRLAKLTFSGRQSHGPTVN